MSLLFQNEKYLTTLYTKGTLSELPKEEEKEEEGSSSEGNIENEEEEKEIPQKPVVKTLRFSIRDTKKREKFLKKSEK